VCALMRKPLEMAVEIFLFLMNAVAAAPPPSLMYKGTRAQDPIKPINSMIHTAGRSAVRCVRSCISSLNFGTRGGGNGGSTGLENPLPQASGPG